MDKIQNASPRAAQKLRDAYRRVPGADFWAALLATLLAAGLFIAVFGMRYEVNDDAIISNIAAGAYGEASHFLVYVNVLFGWFLKPFYALAPGLNWFVVLLLAGGVLCFALLGRLLLQRAGLLRGGVLFAALLVMAGQQFFTRFHYVKYGALFIATGLVLVALHLGQKRPAVWVGLALCLVGSLLRSEQFAAVGGLAAPLLLFSFFHLGDKSAKKRAVLQVGCLVAAALLLAGADALAYHADPGWQQYTRFNAVRTSISDFKLQFATAEDIAPLGYSANDFEMLQQWAYYDGEVFPLEQLEAVESALPGNNPVTAVKTSLIVALRMLYSSPLHLLLAAVLLGWLLLSKKKGWPVVVGTLALLGAMVLFLNWRGRYLERIDSLLCLAVILFCACVFCPARPPSARGTLLVCLLLGLACLPSFSADKTTADDYWLSRPPRAAEIDPLAEDKATLYLLDTDLVDAANGYDVWRTRPKGYFSNLVFVGSWLMDSPLQNEALAAYGVQNPYRDALGREDVLFADFYHRALKEDYLREHYQPDAQLALVAEMGDYNLYRAE